MGDATSAEDVARFAGVGQVGRRLFCRTVRGDGMIDECGLCDARRDDVREYDAGSGLYLCRPCRVTEDEYRDIARVRGVFGFDTDAIGGE